MEEKTCNWRMIDFDINNIGYPDLDTIFITVNEGFRR